MYGIHGSEVVINGDPIDSAAVAAIELDLTRVRTHIAALRAESVSLAAELLAALDPLERTLAEAIEGPDRGTTSPNPADAIELAGTFEDTTPAVLQLSETDRASAAVVLDLSSTCFGARTPVGAAT